MFRSCIIQASELAACVGRNKYKSRDDMILKYLQLLAPQSYELLNEITGQQTQMEAARKVSKRLSELDPKMASSIKTEISQMVEIASSSSNYKDTVSQTLASIQSKLSKTSLTVEEKEVAQQDLQKRLYTQIGTHKEASVVNQIGNTKRVTGYFRKYVSDGYSPDGLAVQIYIGGKLDAIQTLDSGEKVIIEVKNRMNRLFNNVVEYERVQVYAYMFIHDIKIAKIVERFHGTTVEHEVRFDDIYWSDIVRGLKAFVQEVADLAHRYNPNNECDIESDGS